MAELKTKKTKESVAGFIAAIADNERRQDCEALVKLMKKVTKADPKMWGPSIIGFGEVRLVYDSGRELDWFPIGFSPRKDAIALYLSGGLEMHAADLKALGKHKTGKGCLYVKKLSDVKLPILESMLKSCLKGASSSRRVSPSKKA